MHCDAGSVIIPNNGGILPANQTDFNQRPIFLRDDRLRMPTEKRFLYQYISQVGIIARAPHLHLGSVGSSEKSIRTTQIAFPKSVMWFTFIALSNYKGWGGTLWNSSDNVFLNSIEAIMADFRYGQYRGRVTPC